MVLVIPIRLDFIKFNKNKLNTDSRNNISDNKINNRIINLLSSIKKMSFKVSFLISKADSAFI